MLVQPFWYKLIRNYEFKGNHDNKKSRKEVSPFDSFYAISVA